MRGKTKRRALGLTAVLWAASAPLALQAEVKIFRADRQEAIASGTLDGVSLDPEGRLALAREVTRVALLEEPFVFSGAAASDGWWVGTGNSGKVLRVDAAGSVSEVFAAPEPEIYALWAEDDGSLLVGSSPAGKVYQVADGEASEIFDPEELYIWALARDRRGRLLVATGFSGTVYRIEGDGEPEVVFRSPDTHVRSLHPLADGGVLIGTAGQGLVLRLGTDDSLTTVYDAGQPEVLAFTDDGEGTVWAALIASEASSVDLSTTQASSSSNGGETATVTVVEQGQTTVGSRGSGFEGARSAILEIRADGTTRELFEIPEETVHSLLYSAGDLWLGTGQEGKLYRWTEEGLVHERELEERQITALVAGPAGAAALTANTTALYRLGSSVVGSGVFTSPVLDAESVSRFGSFRWEGELPKGTAVNVAARSGQSSQPDATWTDWMPLECSSEGDCVAADGRRHELSSAAVGAGRYVQWRARLEARGGASPRIMATELSYRQINRGPEISELEVLAPGEILVPNSFNPQNQAYEPWSPNREGIFTSLREPSGQGDGRLKTLWKKGYRTLQWKAEDPNGDELTYRLELRRAASSGAWLPMVSELDDTYYSFDSTVLPDGVYRFRLTAVDGPEEDEGSRSEEELTAPVVIDHTPPKLGDVKSAKGKLVVTIEDAANPIRTAEISIDAGEWRAAESRDGLLDGRREVLDLEVPEGARWILLRVSDAAFNVLTFELSRRIN